MDPVVTMPEMIKDSCFMTLKLNVEATMLKYQAYIAMENKDSLTVFSNLLLLPSRLSVYRMYHTRHELERRTVKAVDCFKRNKQ